MTGWVLETLAASALLMALVLLVRGPARRAFGPEVGYALWLLPVIRMGMPPLSTGSGFSQLVRSIAEQARRGPGYVMGVTNPAIVPADIARQVTQVSVTVGHYQAQAAFVPPVAVAQGPTLAVLLLSLWAIGAAAFLLYHIVAHRRFCARLLHRASAPVRIAGVEVIASDAAQGPLAFGVLRRYVAFPRDFVERFDADERELALLHELGHHERGDLIANWVALAVLALHWFNPLAWHAFRAFRADQEMANDARVLARRGRYDRHSYACAIVKAAHGGAIGAACHLHTIHDLKGRLKMLKKARRSRPVLAAGMASVAALTVAGLGLTASGTKAAERIERHVAAITPAGLGKLPPAAAPKLAQVAPPAAPAAPVAPGNPQPPRAPAVPLTDDDADVTTTTTPDGKTVHQRVVVIRNGKRLHPGDKGYAVPSIPLIPPVPPIPAIPPVPQVSSATCGPPLLSNPVEHRQDGGRHVIIMCRDRIEMQAADGRKMALIAMTSHRPALTRSIESLRSARTRIEATPEIPADARAEALAGIDRSIRDLEADLAKTE